MTKDKVPKIVRDLLKDGGVSQRYVDAYESVSCVNEKNETIINDILKRCSEW